VRSLSAELARSVLDAAPDAMIVIDAAGKICFGNQQVCALFGYTREELLGMPVEWLMPERLRSRHPALREDYVRNGRVRPMGAGLDLHGRRRDGAEFPVEISLSPIEDGGNRLVAAAIRDITERKRVEEVVREARASADRANQAKSRFLAMASHDLRQPLQSLSLLAGTLRRSALDAAQQQVLTQQEQAISGMSRLLNALLDISKLESGAIRPDPSDFRVAALFEELRQEFAALADTKGLALEVMHCDDSIHSDPSLVGQILRNLVANAIKYTRAGIVALRCLHDAPLCVRIQVLDTGIGIPAEQLRYIYDEFYQVGGGPNARHEGHGLGLNIVQRLVTLLGLTLDVESQVGKGTAFTLTIPSGQHELVSPALRARPEVPALARRARLHVLVLEDDPAVLAATSLLFRSEGHRVTTATTITMALEMARSEPGIDLLVTDYHLGAGETGTHALATLRDALARPLRAVLITGDTSAAMKALPADPLLRIVSKPVDADELLALVNALMSA
jgi:PAS domain S-box-containing protein